MSNRPVAQPAIFRTRMRRLTATARTDQNSFLKTRGLNLFASFLLPLVPLAACGSTRTTNKDVAHLHAQVSENLTASAACDLQITATAAVLEDPEHPCRVWLMGVYRRVVQIPRGSGVIAGLVRIKGDFLPGLLITARHSSGYFEPETILLDPLAVNVPREFKPVFPQLTTGNGEQCERYILSSSLWFSPELQEMDRDASGRPTTLRPRRDFALGIVVGERKFAPYGQFPSAPLKIALPLLPESEAAAVFGTRETVASPRTAEHVLMVGFPTNNSPAQVAASGRILSALEAEAAVASSDDADERLIPFDPAAEFLVNRIAPNGMSGGGVFNRQGQLIGIMVRSPGNPNAQPAFTRVVRIDWMRAEAERSIRAASRSPRTHPLGSLPSLLSAFSALFSAK